MVIEMRSIEQIEEDYGVELSNEVLAQYWSDQPGNGLGVLSVCSRWMSGHQVDNDDPQVLEAVKDMDKYIAWAREHPGPDVNLDEALAYRAMLAEHWNTQFKDGGERGDGNGPIEAVLE